MLEGVGYQGKNKVSSAPEFLPFSYSVLDKSLVEYAATYLNETEETKRKGLLEIRKFLKKELNFQNDIEENILLCFLRSRKFDVKRTCNLLKALVEFSCSHRYIFDRVDSDAVRRTVESRVIGFLPYRDSKGRAILFIQSELWNPCELKAEDIIFGSMVALHTAGENPVNQVTGFVVVLNFKNLTLHHIIAMSSWLMFGVQALQRCLPFLVKEFHVTHTPRIFRTAWKIVKPLLNEKIKKRIIFYKSSHWDSLHSRIPPVILPEELGGQLGPYSYEHWASDLSSIEKKYIEKIRLFIYREKPH